MPLPNDVCPYCGNVRSFGVWVAAHWNELLETTCGKCDKRHCVHSGRATKVRQKKTKVKTQ